MNLIEKLGIEKCREVFEQHQAKLLNMDYQELKEQFDRHEKCFNKRYATFSDFEKEFVLWQAAWGIRQNEIDQFKADLTALENEHAELLTFNEKLDRERNSYRDEANAYRERNGHALHVASIYLTIQKDDPDLTIKAMKRVLIGTGDL